MSHNKRNCGDSVFQITANSSSEFYKKKFTWNIEYDNQLLKLVEFNKGKNWKQVANSMQTIFNNPGFTPKKCRERWCNNADPDLNRGSLNDNEELFLMVYQKVYKNKWVLISQHIPRRNSSKLKNNFSSYIRKICRKIFICEIDFFISVFEYVRILYACSLISDLLNIKGNLKKAILLAPIHIYDHINLTQITEEMCLLFIHKSTETFVKKRKNSQKIKRLLKLNSMDKIKEFVNRITTIVKDRFNSADAFTEEILISILIAESAEEESLANERVINPIFSSSANNDFLSMNYQEPLAFPENYKTYKLQSGLYPIMYTSMQPNSIINFPSFWNYNPNANLYLAENGYQNFQYPYNTYSAIHYVNIGCQQFLGPPLGCQLYQVPNQIIHF